MKQVAGVYIVGSSQQFAAVNNVSASDFSKEVLWADALEKRDKLLYESDWTQCGDCHLATETVALFVEYRQALRDIPQTYSDVIDIVWPQQPNVSKASVS